MRQVHLLRVKDEKGIEEGKSGKSSLYRVGD